MERPKRARSSFDHVGIARTRSSTPTSGQNMDSGVLKSAFVSRNRSLIDSSSPSNSHNNNASASAASAARRRHNHQMSLPQYLGLNGMTVDSPEELSPFEERFLGRVPRAAGIPLAEPYTPPPTVVGKLFSGVKRAVTLKRDKTPPEDESGSVAQSTARYGPVGHSSTFPLSLRGQQFSNSSVDLVNRPRTAPISNSNSKSIITAHRSPFGGYTKSGDFVVTRTTDGRRLPVPQPHPHSYTNPHVKIPPPPAHSAMKKSSGSASNISFDSDSFTLVTTPDSASSTGSTNGSGSVGKTGKNITMISRLMGKSQKKGSTYSYSGSSGVSSTDSSEVIITRQISARKAVRFSVDTEEKQQGSEVAR